MNAKKHITNDIASYYSQRIREHGPTARGVDWNSSESQQLRFVQLTKILAANHKEFSLLDYGCGFGSLYEYTSPRFPEMSYTGFDIVPEMIALARARHSSAQAQWCESLNKTQQFDYVIASGIFNVKLTFDTDQWWDYILDLLHVFNHHAVLGFSFNVLTKYSDHEHMKPYLYYADPCLLFDFCKNNFSKHIALLHDYPLYEFTILVRKHLRD